MKTTYLGQHRRTPRGRLIATSFIALFFSLAFIADRLNPATIPGFLIPIARPLWATERFVSDNLSTAFSFFIAKSDLANENKILKQQLSELSLKLLADSGLASENESLRSLVELGGTNKKILAEVLSKPPISPYDVLVINVGSENGVEVGDQIVVTGGVVIGEVEKAFSTYSQVVLYSNPGKQTQVLIGEKRLAATAQGVGGGAFQVILPRETEVKSGDGIFFAGPPPMLYGKVVSVDTRDTDFLELVTFISPVNIYELRFVAVFLQNHESEHREASN